MSFWHTTVGKFIHHASGNNIGKGGHHSIKLNGPVTTSSVTPTVEIPKQCYTDINYYVSHLNACTNSVSSLSPAIDPGTPVIPVIQVPVLPSMPVTSSVPEPASIFMFSAALIVVAVFRGFRTNR